MNDALQYVYWNNTIQEWVTALVILLCLFAAARILGTLLAKYIKRAAARTQTMWDDFLILQTEKSLLPLAYVAAFYFAAASLHLPAAVRSVLHAAVLVVCTFFILRIVAAVITECIHSFIKHRENGETKEKQARGLVIILNVVIWILGGVFLIDNFGYDVTTIVAGLGIGGIAIALAAQTILGDLFSYFVIFFDRPFEIGDFVIVDDKMGTVEHVGIKTTRIRTLSGEQLVCSNTDLTNSRLHNYKRMDKRRVVFKAEVVYQTPYEKLRQISGWVKNIIESRENVTFDRGHFSGFGSSSLDFEFVYYVNGADYNIYMDIHESILLDIVQLFEDEEIEFAYPTQTLFVNNIPELSNTIKP